MARGLCPKCGRKLAVIGTRIDHECQSRVRYLGHAPCRYRACGVEIVPLASAPAQSRVGRPQLFKQ